MTRTADWNVASHDAESFTRLVETYRTTVCSIALAIVRDVPTSEDVAQEVFLEAWRHLGQLRKPQSIGAWLRQITRNRATDRLRARHRETPLDPLVHEARPDGRMDLERSVLDNEESRLLAEALEALEEDQRETMLLYYREDQSVRRVAQRLDCSEVAVKKRLSRARAKMRQSVMARFGEVSCTTAPGRAFTTAVLAAVSVAAPSTASAATVAATSLGAGKIAQGLLWMAGWVVGPVAGLLGIHAAMNAVTRRARTQYERRALARVRWISMLHLASSMVVLSFIIGLARSVWLWVWFAWYAGVWAAIVIVWLPRIIEDREAAERRDSPEARARQRREKVYGLLGGLAGLAAGAFGIWWGLQHGW